MYLHYSGLSLDCTTYPTGEQRISRDTDDTGSAYVEIIGDSVGITQSGYISTWKIYASRATDDVSDDC